MRQILVTFFSSFNSDTQTKEQEVGRKQSSMVCERDTQKSQ